MADKLWDVRTGMEEEQAKKLQEILNNHTHRESYFLCRYANWEGADSNVMRIKYRLTSTPPLKLLGSTCWFVDNKQGIFKMLWELPFDHNIDPSLFDQDASVEQVAKSIQGMENVVQFG